MPTYTCVVTVTFTGNKFEATDEQDYKQKVKDDFYDEFGFLLEHNEITNITKEEK